MKLSYLDPKYVNLLENQSLSKTIYEKLSNRIFDQVLKNQLQILKSRKEVYLKEIMHLYGLDTVSCFQDLRKRNQTEMDKIDIKINDLILNQNTPVLLDFCLLYEQRIYNLYQAIIDYIEFGNLEYTIIKNQLKDSKQIIDEIKLMKRVYGPS